MTETELIHKLWSEYECEHNHMAASGRAVAEWAVSKGLLSLPQPDPLDLLAGKVSRALGHEYSIDPKGRRYRRNHAIRVMKNGVQTTMWGIMGFAPHEHMEMAFTQRREQIVGDCCQLKTDADVYNDMNSTHPLIDLVWDFADDIAEREVSYNGYDDEPEQ